jgi:uncharacterized protein (DUF2252 family)
VTGTVPPLLPGSDGSRPFDPVTEALIGSTARSSVEDRRDTGRDARGSRARTSFADWTPAADRPDPVAVIEQQNSSRLAALVPERRRRMLLSPFSFYRGGAAVMAADLGVQPSTGLVVQLCGDAHLANFGLFGSPERALVFDLNDFDETHLGPFEWDVIRLAVSGALLGRDRGWSQTEQDDLVRSTVSSYRNAIGVFAGQSNLEVWFASMRAEDLEGFTVNEKGRQRLERTVSKARANDLNRAVAKFTEVVDGRRQFRDDPPLLHRVETFYSSADPDQIGEALRRFLVDYLLTLPDDAQLLMSRYRVLDEALKVVGVGSVGTRCYILLGEGRDAEDLMLLQVKEADTSVLAPWWESSAFSNEGERVVQGQRIMQAASDPFLGWAQMGSKYYYLRQFRDMKGSVDLSEIPRGGASRYLSLCGWTLARAHARSGDAVAISAYLGTTDKFDEALVTFARRYADQVELDYRAFAAAASSGRLAVAADPLGS